MNNILISVIKLDAFDILDRASGELSHLAASVGIDFAALLPLLSKDTETYQTGIALDKTHKGKVKAWFEVKTAKSGQEFPLLTFNTLAGGGYSETFNGWQWLRENNLVGGDPLTDSEKATIQAQRVEREQRHALNAQNHAQAQALTQEQSIKRFNDFVTLFDTLPLLTDTAGTYLAAKGFSIENLPADFVFKRGKDWRGGFIVYALKNAQHKRVGFQKLYDAKFSDQDGKARDKDFIFLPNTKRGSYAILGKTANTSDKLFCTEGLTNGLTTYLATGKPCVICLDAGNLRPVIEHLSKWFKSITIAADNDIHINGNTGLYHALITAKAFNCSIVYPELNGVKCDFDDIRQKQDVKEVKRQLRSNKLDFTDSIIYYLLLIKTVFIDRKTDLEKHIKSACFMIANSLLLSDNDTIQASGNALQAIINDRQLMLNNEPISAAAYIAWFLNKKLLEIRKANSIVFIPDNVTVHNCMGKTNAEIAVLMRQHKKAIWLDTRPMGTGKTELMQLITNIVRDYGQANAIYRQITYIAHRTALIKDASNRLELEYYENIDWSNGERAERLATTVNSMINHAVAAKVNVLFIDEIRQTLEHVLHGTCDNRLAVYNALIEAIQNADIVLCADADLNQFTLDWINSIANKPLHIIQNDTVKTGKTIVELKTNAVLFDHAKKALLSGEAIWISTDSKSKAENMEEFLKCLNDDNNNLGTELNGLLTDKDLKLTTDTILLVTSENKADIKQAAFLANPNKESKKYRVIIHTPVISSGVSITNGHFKNVYAIFCNVVAPNEMLQTIARVRTAQEIFCTFKTGYSKNRITNKKDLIDGETIKRGRFVNNQKTLDLDDFDNLRLEQLINKNKALNDFKSYFLLLAQQKGYDVIPCNDDTEQSETALQLDADLKKISQVVKERTINSIIDAERIDSDENERIERLSATTQNQSNAAKRYTVAVMTGKDNTGLGDNDITPKDVDFILFNRGASVIANYELLAADIEDLKDSDNANLVSRDKLASRTSKHLLFKTVINGIERLENGTFNSVTAGHICGFLQDNYQELAANGLGNYKQVSRYPVKQLTAFLAKIGYEVKQVSQAHDGQRLYMMTVNEQVQGYALARIERRRLNENTSTE